MTSPKFFVYVDWTIESIARPFYVGKGNANRVKCFKRNSLHTRISQKYGINRKIVFETEIETEAFERERHLIRELNTYRYSDDGWGANFTLGGDGRAGADWSAEQREQMSESAKQRWTDPDKRERYVESNRARWTAERIEHHSEVAKQRWSKIEEREHASEAAHERWDSDNARAAQSDAVKRLWADPTYRSKLSKPRICKRCKCLGHMAKTCSAQPTFP